MERIGSFIIKILIAFLLILVLFDMLDWFNVIYGESETILAHAGEISIFDYHISYKPVIYFIFDIYTFLKLTGLFLFGITGIGSLIYLIIVIVSRIFFRGSMPFLFAIKTAIVSAFGVYCSQYDVIREFCINVFNKIGSLV